MAQELYQALLHGLREDKTIKVVHIVDFTTEILDVIVREIIEQSDPCVKPIADDVVQVETSNRVGSNPGGVVGEGPGYARGQAPDRKSADSFGGRSRRSSPAIGRGRGILKIGQEDLMQKHQLRSTINIP